MAEVLEGSAMSATGVDRGCCLCVCVDSAGGSDGACESVESRSLYHIVLRTGCASWLTVPIHRLLVTVCWAVVSAAAAT